MKLFPVAVACTALFFGANSNPALAETASNDDLKAFRKSLDELKAQQADLNKQIQEIKTQIHTATPAPGAAPSAPSAQPAKQSPISYLNSIPYELTAEDRTTGSKDAKVVMMEFSDLQCPFCAHYHTTSFQQIMTNYVATGKIRYVFRDLPIPSHKNEMKFAETSRCAADKGKFWEVHDYIFRNQDKLTADNVTTKVADLGLDVNELNSCVASQKLVTAINKDGMDAMKMGASSTPTLFIAMADGANKVRVVRKIKGAGNYDLFKGVLDEVLAAANAKP